MKLLKNISLVYTLQILAVLILFFYPNYTTQAGLNESLTSAKVEKNKDQFAEETKVSLSDAAVGSSIINSLNTLWLTGDKKITARNDCKTKAGEADENLKNKYHIDALFLNQLSFINFKIADKAVNRVFE